MRAGVAAGLILLAGAAAAQEHRFGLSVVTFDGHAVTFRNGLTPVTAAPDEFSVDMTNGVTVKVVIMQGSGLTPDTMVVLPPPGYIAAPAEVVVEEHDMGVIYIAPEAMS